MFLDLPGHILCLDKLLPRYYLYSDKVGLIDFKWSLRGLKNGDVSFNRQNERGSQDGH